MKNIVFAIFAILLVIGGLGGETIIIALAGMVFSCLILLWILFSKKKIQLPTGAYFYLIFILLFAVSLFWSKVFFLSLGYFLLFLSGGLFWIAFYNLKKDYSDAFPKLIIFIGLAFGFLYFINRIQGRPLVSPFSLDKFSTAVLNHHHIGDLWAAILPIIFLKFIKKSKFKILWGVLGTLGIYFLAVSLSRSAYLAAIAGTFYVFNSLGLIKKYRVIFTTFIAIIFLMFLVVGSQKSIISSRQYFLQGLVGLIRNPVGVGVGSFDVISKDPANHILGFSGFSSVAHNIFLEILTGMGILGISFLAWFIKVFLNIWGSKDKNTLLPRAVFIALTVNFFFDYTYFIPTMLMLWFASLGLSQEAKKE